MDDYISFVDQRAVQYVQPYCFQDGGGQDYWQHDYEYESFHGKGDGFFGGANGDSQLDWVDAFKMYTFALQYKW